MNSTTPIKEAEKVHQLLQHFKKDNSRKGKRNYLLFMFGIHTGLRITDILEVRKSMIEGNYLSLKADKRSKEKRIPLSEQLMNELEPYLLQLNDEDYLFSGSNRTEPLTRARAYQILNEAGNANGLSNIGTHTLRKTFGYHLYLQTKDLEKVKLAMGYEYCDTTLIDYLNIRDLLIEDIMSDFSL